MVYEFNKRDMDDLLTIEELNQDLNPWHLPYFETIATQGTGVLETFEAISVQAISNLSMIIRNGREIFSAKITEKTEAKSDIFSP